MVARQETLAVSNVKWMSVEEMDGALAKRSHSWLVNMSPCLSVITVYDESGQRGKQCVLLTLERCHTWILAESNTRNVSEWPGRKTLISVCTDFPNIRKIPNVHFGNLTKVSRVVLESDHQLLFQNLVLLGEYLLYSHAQNAEIPSNFIIRIWDHCGSLLSVASALKLCQCVSMHDCTVWRVKYSHLQPTVRFVIEAQPSFINTISSTTNVLKPF